MALQHASGDVSVRHRTLSTVEYELAHADADDTYAPVRKVTRVAHAGQAVVEWDTVRALSVGWPGMHRATCVPCGGSDLTAPSSSLARLFNHVTMRGHHPSQCKQLVI